MNTHPSFDAEDNEVLQNLVPEGAEPGTPASAAPVDPTPSPAPAPGQAPAPEPTAAPAPADAPAATPAPSSEPAPSPAPAPQGDARAALRASRREEKRLRNELERLQQENEALKNGKHAGNDSLELTDAELEELRTDYPTQYKIAMASRQLQEHLKQQRQIDPTDTTDGFEPPRYAPEVQVVIDQVPQLLAWQYDPNSQDKFARAIEFDKALEIDPDWRGKPAAERFAEAARRADPASAITPSAAPAAPRQDPAAVIDAAPTGTPKGLSDLRGGGPANAPALDFSRMSDAEIMAALPVS